MTKPNPRFYAEFAKAMVSDHKRELAAYQLQSKRKGPLADFAAETVPTLQEHLERAKSLTRVKPSH